ncbi:unnamed protein product [Pieris brassicae]|uniref:Uncharacterized protein n=1 Tax=Pieris brassicae TaxID=7116 RepID=A0A9P0TXZ0_PIEBR|nr:unnamed protein product [Pieris brassicae]
MLAAIIVYHLIDNVVGDIDGNANAVSVESIFDGVYSECLLKFSYTCLQRKTLLYLKSLNRLSEVSIIGDYVKFVKINATESKEEDIESENSNELSVVIDKTVDNFFDNHLIRFSALGKDVLMPNTVEKFVGRKKRKGGGGGGHGGDDGGKKKMFMMAMMCMKMKMMVMVPAMMGMMGMMSFKGMMFSMMSYMVSKMLLLMKLLEKKGGGGGGGAGWNTGGDAGWASSGGGGAWMPTGADYGSGGYDSNGQWQSRSILERLKDENIKPKIPFKSIPYSKMDTYKNKTDKAKLRKRRGIIDTLHNAYMYWISKIIGGRYNPKFKVVNGIKYVYQPTRVHKRVPKVIKNKKPVIVTEEFNKGEIVEGPEGRMTRRKFNKMKENVQVAVDENPWE